VRQRSPASSLFAENPDYVPLLLAPFVRYRVSLHRKKCRQQIIGLNDEPFPVAMRIYGVEKSVLGEMFGDAVRPALCM
jgi:hypothetical protein